MTFQNNAGRSIIFCLANLLAVSLPLSVQAQDEDILKDLPYDESFIQEKIAQFTVSAESTDAAVKIPAYLAYKLAFRKILAEEQLQAQINAADLEMIRNLPAPSDRSFLAKDQKEITGICIQTNNMQTPAQILDVAAQYDDSRRRKESALDAFYDGSLTSLSAETRTVIQNLLADFDATNQISYATFDMAGFAQEVPEAAKALLIIGCENFSAEIIAYTPQSVKLGDL